MEQLSAFPIDQNCDYDINTVLDENTWYDIDFYKADHRRQYPESVRFIYSNFIPRTTRVKNINHIVVFGNTVLSIELQKLTDWILSAGEIELEKYAAFMRQHLNVKSFDVSHLEDLLSYVQEHEAMPVHIRMLPEGSVVPIQTPVLTIQNVDGRFPWLVNYLETFISAVLWHPMTVATIANRYRCVFDGYAAVSGVSYDMPDFPAWQGHDFSLRGMPGIKAGRISGMAHLASFSGTDTCPSVGLIEKIYPKTGTLTAGSVPATEHSVMCCDGAEGEQYIYERLLTEVYPTGIVSIVADSYDFWSIITELLPKLKDKIMLRDGKLVIRPDSGDPVLILTGDPQAETEHERKGLIQCLVEIFGYTENRAGFKVLHPKIGAIYGDSITLDRQEQILQRLIEKRYAVSCVVLGIGSFSYQYVTRDTFGFAMKATAVAEYVGEGPDRKLVWRSIYKQPKTDSGKNSRRGRLAVIQQTAAPYYRTIDNATEAELAASALVPLPESMTDDFNVVRNRLAAWRNA